MQAPACLAEAGVQSRLITRWREVHSSSTCGSRNNDAGSDERGAFVSSEQRAFFGFCSSWKDILLTQRPYLTRCGARKWPISLIRTQQNWSFTVLTFPRTGIPTRSNFWHSI